MHLPLLSSKERKNSEAGWHVQNAQKTTTMVPLFIYNCKRCNKNPASCICPALHACFCYIMWLVGTADAQCICKCPNPTPAPTPAPTETVCKKLKGEIKDKCGGDSPVNKVIQNAQDAVDTSPQDPMVDLGEYKLSDLEKEQKEGTCSFAKSDPAYLATELILKINKLSTLV